MGLGSGDVRCDSAKYSCIAADRSLRRIIMFEGMTRNVLARLPRRTRELVIRRRPQGCCCAALTDTTVSCFLPSP